MIKKYLTDINNNIYIKEMTIKKSKNNSNNLIKVDLDNEIGLFYGFGSAITESSGFNYQNLSEDSRKNFIKDYFSLSGLNYNYGRISIGSNDFSLSSYSYAKKRNLNDFSVSRDKKYVIPFLLDILKNKNISLIASSWSPPKMYKRLPILYYGIKLSKRHYDRYSDYLINFINEYRKLGIKIDYLTMQNEPVTRQHWESCVFKLDEQKDFIYNHLLNKLTDTKVLLWDHNKDNLFNIISDLYIKNDKVGGVAFHYYTGNHFDEIKKIREKYKELFLVNSEMCCAYSPYNEKNWISSAEYYINDIIGDMNNGINAYLDWNILLDENGGPTYKNNPVKSASIRIGDNYVKSPIYYYLYHISHFIDNSIIIKNENNTNLKIVSLKNNKKIIVVIMNKSNQDIEYNLLLKNKNIYDEIKKHTIVTYEIT